MAPRTQLRSTLMLATVLVLVWAAPRPAQSQADLRRENQRLQSQVSDLQTELDAARQRLVEMEAQIAQLREAVGAARRGERPRVPEPPLEEPQVSIDESQPRATPRALMRSMVDRYEKEIGVLPIGQYGDRERVQYLMAARGWVSKINREVKGPIAWPVRLQKVLAVDRGLVAELQCTDPETDAKLGRPFLVHLPSNVARRLKLVEDRGELDQVLIVRGTLVPTIRFNRSRVEAGPFDNPPLIGPFAEFGIRVETRSLMPRAEDEEAQRADATP